MALKLNIGTKDGKTISKELADNESNFLKGKSIGDTFSGDQIGYPGYEFKITGGSDNAGFPMRKDVQGTGRKKILTTASVGFNAKRKGLRERRTVAGGTIGKNTVQVNIGVVKQGDKPLGEEKTSEKDSEQPAEEQSDKAGEEPAEQSEAGDEEKEESKDEKEEQSDEDSEEKKKEADEKPEEDDSTEEEEKN